MKQLGYAVAVADHGHFGRAAEAEFVSQPALSSQIRELERRLDVQLFERGRHGARLTAAGAEIVDAARRLLSDASDLHRIAAAHDGVVRGTVRLAAIPTVAPYLLPQTVALLRRRWPDARLELVERHTEDLLGDVATGRCDLGLLATPYDTGALVVEPVVSEPFHLAVPAGDPLGDDTDELPVESLADLDLLFLEEGHCLREHALQVCALAGGADHRSIEDASLGTLAQMVAAGVGMTLLPASALAVEAGPSSGLRTRPLGPPHPGRTVSLAWRASDPRHDLFLAVSEALRSALGG